MHQSTEQAVTMLNTGGRSTEYHSADAYRSMPPSRNREPDAPVEMTNTASDGFYTHGGQRFSSRSRTTLGDYEGPESTDSTTSSWWVPLGLAVLVAAMIVVIAGGIAIMASTLHGVYDGEYKVSDALTLEINLQRTMYKAMRASQLCLIQKQLQCIADGLDPIACNATALELDALCPIPEELLQLLSESNVSSALTESGTDVESVFPPQQDELYS